MKKLNFKQQFSACIAILVVCFILSTLTKQGVFTNIAWIIYGLCFIINPVWPEMWEHHDHQKMKLGCRIGGVLVIIIGLITRFGV